MGEAVNNGSISIQRTGAMMDTWYDLLDSYIYEFDGENDPPIAFAIAGAGTPLCDLATVPGSSKMIYSIGIPYAQNSLYTMLGMITAPTPSTVSAGHVSNIYNSIRSRADAQGHNVDVIVISGALTTNRVRHGDDHVYIRHGSTIYHLQSYKLTDEERSAIGNCGINRYRLMQELAVADWVMTKLVLSYDSDITLYGACITNVEVIQL